MNLMQKLKKYFLLNIQQTSDDLIDQFFNFTLTTESCASYVRPKLEVRPLAKSEERPQPRKLKYKGSEYTNQYQHDLVIRAKVRL
jgi:hypothetical protein